MPPAIGRSARWLLAVTLIGFVPVATLAAVADAPEPDERPTSGGRLAVDFDEELDLLGDLWVDLPVRVRNGHWAYLALDARTSIEKASSDFAFEVRDLDYHLELGWRGHPARLRGRPLSIYLGQRGKQRVDDDGQPYLRYLGASLESRGHRRATPVRDDDRWLGRPGIEWKLAGGPVVEERELDASFVLRGEARWMAPVGRSAAGLQLSFDGLVDDGNLLADIALGPRVDLPMGGDRAVTLFAVYQRSRNPLGIGHSAVLAGFGLSEGVADGAHADRAGSEIGGQIGFGGGERGRWAGQLKLRFLSAEWIAGTQAVFVVDANLLTADDTGDLYYFYHLGLERGVGSSRTGLYFYHRSNHQFAEPNDTVTSLNVVEGGIETAAWHRPGRRRAPGSWGRLDGRARLGFLLDSSFGEDRSWHARGGLRWTLPDRLPGPGAFLKIEAEEGDVERRLLAVGVTPGEKLDLQVEYRRDSQLFSVARRVWLLTVRYGF